MFLVQVHIKRRKSILDPQGKAIEKGAKLLGYNNVSDVRVDKHIEFYINTADETAAKSEAYEFCNKLLANPVMEEYQINLIKQ